MKHVPHAQGVTQALQSVRAAAKKSLKGLNQAAGQRMVRGDYAAAEALAAKGRELQQFGAEVEALGQRWREIRRGGGPSKVKETTTPLWAYYQPILKALADAGGEARRTELEPVVERVMAGTLQPGDREPLGRGTKRWQVMIRRARKHLIAEGWLASGSNPVWRITETGRRTAAKPLGTPKSGLE